jgi:hypothetical protein
MGICHGQRVMTPNGGGEYQGLYSLRTGDMYALVRHKRETMRRSPVQTERQAPLKSACGYIYWLYGPELIEEIHEH